MGQHRLLRLASAALFLGGSPAPSQDKPPAAPAPPPGHETPARPMPGRGPGWLEWFKRGPQRGGSSQPGADRLSKWPADRALMYMLAEVPAPELEQQLAKWPRFQEMPEAEKHHFRLRLDQFRKGRTQTALNAAKQLQIAIPAEREEEFTREFWRGRRKIEETLWREMEPRRRELESSFRAELSGKFSTP